MTHLPTYYHLGPVSTRRVYGNMTGDGDHDSLDSDSDMLLDGDTGDSDEEELEGNDMAAESRKNRKSAKIKAMAELSDDDFWFLFFIGKNIKFVRQR